MRIQCKHVRSRAECVRPQRQTGSTSVEYAVVTALVVGVLFTPMPVLGVSAVDFVMDALRGYQANTSYLLSLP